jgi:hypothetical protein
LALLKDGDPRLDRQYHKNRAFARAIAEAEPAKIQAEGNGFAASRNNNERDLLAAVLFAFLGEPLDRGNPLALGGREHDNALCGTAGDANTIHGTSDELAAVGDQHDVIGFLDRE